MGRIINKSGTIAPELSVDFLQKCSDLVDREWTEKQARLVAQRDENRKYYFPQLWAEEHAAESTQQLIDIIADNEESMTQETDIFERDTYQVWANEVLMWEGWASDEQAALQAYATTLGSGTYRAALLQQVDPMHETDLDSLEELKSREEKVQAADAEAIVVKWVP